MLKGYGIINSLSTNIKKIIVSIMIILFALIPVSRSSSQVNAANNHSSQAVTGSVTQPQNSNSQVAEKPISEVVPSTNFQGYKTYKNYRFDYQIDYPGDFIKTINSSNGGGVVLTSSDKQASLMIEGMNNHNLDVKHLYESDLKWVKGEMVYTYLGNNEYVISWKTNGHINYRKICVVKNYHYGFTFSYSEDQKAQYDDVVAKLVASLQNEKRIKP